MTRPTLLTGKEKRRVSVFSILLTVVIVIICLLFLLEIWFLRRFTPVKVDGYSMMNTLEDGDWLYADSEATPKRGDIVIIDVSNATDEDGKPLFRNDISFIIKRVIALGGDEIFDIGFDARQVVENKYFQKILTVPVLNKLLRKGDVIPSLPKNLFPKRVPFYFQFQPSLSISQIQNQQEMALFRDQIQQQIYQALAQLKQIRAGDLPFVQNEEP